MRTRLRRVFVCRGRLRFEAFDLVSLCLRATLDCGAWVWVRARGSAVCVVTFERGVWGPGLLLYRHLEGYGRGVD